MVRMIATADVIDSPGIYDYSPSIVNGRAFVTTARKGPNGGSDAIVSLRLGRPETQTPAFQWPGRLVADPFALRINARYLVLFTVGMPDGHRNGVGYAWTSSAAVMGAPHTLIPQHPDPGTYGIGQPSVACLPDGRQLLWVRSDGPGAGIVRAWWLTTTGGRVALGRELAWAEPEDGASPEVFFAEGSLWCLVAGGGYAGLRRYRLVDDELVVRDRAAETSHGGLMCIASVPVPGMVDGCGIERGRFNQPLIGPAGLTFWQGTGDTGYAGAERTWRLTRHTIGLPA